MIHSSSKTLLTVSNMNQEIVDYKSIKKHAEDNRWNAFKIAAKSGGAVSTATVANVLNGSNRNPGVVALKAICDVIEFPIEKAFVEPMAA